MWCVFGVAQPSIRRTSCRKPGMKEILDTEPSLAPTRKRFVTNSQADAIRRPAGLLAITWSARASAVARRAHVAVIRDDLPFGRSDGTDCRTRHREPDRTWRDLSSVAGPLGNVSVPALPRWRARSAFSKPGESECWTDMSANETRASVKPSDGTTSEAGFHGGRLDGGLQAEFHHSPSGQPEIVRGVAGVARKGDE